MTAFIISCGVVLYTLLHTLSKTAYFIVYKFTISPNDFQAKVYPSGKIKIEPAVGCTCSRCWQIVPSINEDELCDRCAEVVKNLKNKNE